ncbi:hypothetical protein Pla163_32000 [Planctomycetes bacterium Pla163]|uniref:Uncharacterized protein n=1 Tax=Rohdeia mirabilis TaxID=2528008 RepID=A0A518D3J4_9BACT|nr:hypothetical protein Pla163_32000 [Planctomycetes bacterium Pla163]
MRAAATRGTERRHWHRSLAPEELDHIGDFLRRVLA